MITKVAFIAHPTRDMDAMKRFFGEALGLKKAADYQGKWVEFDTPEGKSIACDAFSPEGTKPYLALESDDIEADVQRLKSHSAVVIKDVWDNGPCKMALVADPAGQALMLHQISAERMAQMKKASPKPRSATKPKPKAKAKARPKAKVKAKARPRVKAKAKPRAKAKRR